MDVDELLRPDRCVFGLPDPEADEELNAIGLEFRVECNSANGALCRITGRDEHRIDVIFAMEWDEGQRTINRYCGVLVSSRWCCNCGLHTRIWLLCDGSLLFSHDWEYYAGAHWVLFDRDTSEKLKQLWQRVRAKNAPCQCPE